MHPAYDEQIANAKFQIMIIHFFMFLKELLCKCQTEPFSQKSLPTPIVCGWIPVTIKTS